MPKNQVLFIEGVGQISKDYGEEMSMFTSALLGRHEYDPNTNMGQSPEEQGKIRSLWKDWQVTVLDYDFGEDKAAVDEISKAIFSGKYRAIVVADLSNSIVFPAFEASFGKELQEFVKKGGYLALPTSELLQMCDVVNRLFETTWRPSSYYRTEWGACHENVTTVNQLFGQTVQI
jgi:hypothetical protein